MPNLPVERSYGCSMGCGNPYDFIVIDVQSGTTEFPCVPCYIQLARDMLEAMTNPESELVQAAMREAGTVDSVPMNQSGPKRGRRNAPVDAEDPDLIAAFDSVITVDDLPDEFK